MARRFPPLPRIFPKIGKVVRNIWTIQRVESIYVLYKFLKSRIIVQQAEIGTKYSG